MMCHINISYRLADFQVKNFETSEDQD